MGALPRRLNFDRFDKKKIEVLMEQVEAPFFLFVNIKRRKNRDSFVTKTSI